MTDTKLPSLKTGSPRVEKGYVSPTPGLSIPYGLIEGSEPGPVLLLTAGVHGSEYCTIEAALRVLSWSPEHIKGTILVLPILNTEGFRKRSIYVFPQDKKNLNRVFPGKQDGTETERLAHWLVSEVFTQVDAYLDLHGGDLDESLSPFSLFPADSESSKKLAQAFGQPVAVAAGGEGYTINAAHQTNVPSIIVEVSGNGLWNDDLVNEVTDGIKRVLIHLQSWNGPDTPPPGHNPQIVSFWTAKAAATGLWYPSKEIGDSIKQGEKIGEIRDVFGEVLATVLSEADGFIQYRLASLSVNEGEALLGISTPVI